MNELRAFGARVCVDQFGSGLSSLSQLLEFDVDELKFDPQFALRIADRPRIQTIVLAGVHLAHTLGFGVVCDGVEDESSERVLASLGCDAAAGRRYSEPLSDTAALAWLESNRVPRAAISTPVDASSASV